MKNKNADIIIADVQKLISEKIEQHIYHSDIDVDLTGIASLVQATAELVKANYPNRTSSSEALPGNRLNLGVPSRHAYVPNNSDLMRSNL